MNDDASAVGEVGDVSADGTHFWDGDVWGWQPLWIPAHDLGAAASERFQLSPSAITLLADGLLNQSWRIDDSTDSYVLRVSRDERSRAQIQYEHDFTMALNAHLPYVIAPLAGGDGQTVQEWNGRLLSLFPFVSGTPGAAVQPQVRARQAAAALAEIHQVSVNHVRMPQRAGFASDNDSSHHAWSRIRPILDQRLARTDERQELFFIFDQETATLDQWTQGLRRSGRRMARSAIHGDYNPRNIIFRNHDIVAVIDWDDCHVDALASELAQAAFTGSGELAIAFWQSYIDNNGAVPRGDIDLLGRFARIGAVSELQYTVRAGQVHPSQALQLLRDLAAHLRMLRDIETQLTA